MFAAAVFAVYGSSLVLAVVLLYFFRMRHWYWHVLSILVAIVIGLIPTPGALQGSNGDLGVGGVVALLFLWGILAPLFPKRRDPRHELPHQA